MNKTSLIAPCLLLAAAATAPATSMADVSANIGWTSDYIFRGIFQEDSSAFAGIDYTHEGGFYAGAWGADVGRGNEIDYYLGYAGGNDDFTWKVGYTAYTYTDDFDDTYGEVNLGIGYSIVALDVAIGEWDGFNAPGAPIDYDFASVTISPEKGPYYKVGIWGGDFENLIVPPGGDADYLEIGYVHAMEPEGIDLSIALTYSSDLTVGNPDDGETGGNYALVFGIKKSIGIRD